MPILRLHYFFWYNKDKEKVRISIGFSTESDVNKWVIGHPKGCASVGQYEENCAEIWSDYIETQKKANKIIY